MVNNQVHLVIVLQQMMKLIHALHRMIVNQITQNINTQTGLVNTMNE